MAQMYGYIRTSRQLQEGTSGMAPASQELQLRRAGVPVPNIFRDVGISGSTGTRERRGWHRLNGRLAGGDTLVVVVIDRIGRRWPDTIRSICELRNRGVKIRSLAETEAQWTHYLETDEGSPEAFFGQVLTMFAAWVADQELASIKRRTRDGLERARRQGKVLGRPPSLRPQQVAAMRRMRQGGASYRQIAEAFQSSATTVRRALQQEGVTP
jgi:putative DNA-invertase from lambdoid prophage Rac